MLSQLTCQPFVDYLCNKTSCCQGLDKVGSHCEMYNCILAE